jgi:hypothetical protein
MKVTNDLKLGQPIEGVPGKYAGITTGTDGVPYALILLDAEPTKELNWRDALAWAAEQSGDLPSRVESAMLFANLKSEFKPEWHWTNTQYSDYGAWFQNFDYGSQDYYGKSAELRARAVRRFPLDSSIL